MPDPKTRKRIRDLLARMGDGATDQEAAAARGALLALLKKHGLTWNDIPRILAVDQAQAEAPPAQRREPPAVNVLEQTLGTVSRHVVASDHERLAMALWMLHSHTFRRFDTAPRLALVSPVSGCGKTTVLKISARLANDSRLSADATPAAIYRRCWEYPTTTWLLDEADNSELKKNAAMRRILNMGHEPDATVSRVIDGVSVSVPLFMPVAIAAIGLDSLHYALLTRSVVINMHKATPRERPDWNAAQWQEDRAQIERWAANATLNLDPPIPDELRDRARDNWRPLLAVADDLGYGAAARKAAVALSGRHQGEPAVRALADTETVFQQRANTDRIASGELVSALHDLPDGEWTEWRGPKEDRQPHKLTLAELGSMFRPFGIRTRSVRFGALTNKGYLRSQFEKAWDRYVRPADSKRANTLRLIK